MAIRFMRKSLRQSTLDATVVAYLINFEGMGGDVEVLKFSERGPRLAVRPYTHTDNYWQVYFDTSQQIPQSI